MRSASKRTRFAWSTPSTQPTSAVTAPKISAGATPPATSVATRRSAPCSSTTRRSSSLLNRHPPTTILGPVYGGIGQLARFAVSGQDRDRRTTSGSLLAGELPGLALRATVDEPGRRHLEPVEELRQLLAGLVPFGVQPVDLEDLPLTEYGRDHVVQVHAQVVDARVGDR